MLEAYRHHVAERAALGIPPLPLTAQQTADVIELLKAPPAGEESFLLDLITHRVPAGVDDAAKVKVLLKRGVRYLLGTQLEDGTWRVRSRSLPTQAYFESGFPHGVDQYISAAATQWAALALLQALLDVSANVAAR